LLGCPDPTDPVRIEANTLADPDDVRNSDRLCSGAAKSPTAHRYGRT
jgi:hypothetical protein